MGKTHNIVPYIIKGKPVFVHSEPTSSSNVINALAPETQIDIVKEESGYLKLLYGGYIMKDSHVVVDEVKLRNNAGDKFMAKAKKKAMARRAAPMMRRAPRRAPSQQTDPLANKIIKVKSSVTRDLNGNFIIDGDKEDNSGLVSSGYDNSGNAIVSSATTGKTYTVPLEYLEVSKPAEGEDAELIFESGEEVFKDETGSDAYNYVANSWLTNAINQGDSAFSSIANNAVSTIASILPEEKFNIENTRSVFGMPYQFTPITDNRLDGSDKTSSFGRKYSQKIVSRAPIMIMQAGSPEFLKGFSDDDKKGTLENLQDEIGEKTGMNNLVNSVGKYYAFKDTHIEYYNGVNQMCRAMGALLGIGGQEITVNGVTNNIASFDWMLASNKSHWGYYAGAVGFYVNAEAQMQDSASNGTRQSALAGQVNQISDQAAELQFILGGISSSGAYGVSDLAGLAHKDQNEVAKTGQDNKNNTFDNTGVIGSLINNINTLMSGGKLIFPEIWSDSSFMRSYNITIKLDSPDCDTLSIYMNILVPLAHIIGFCLPRYSGTNAYVSPFLVRAYLRSMFHVDMGIITNCEIIRGDNQAWNQDGLPTQVMVQMSIKDLYTVMATMISQNGIAQDLIANPAQLDYIANLCGINIAVPDFKRSIALWAALRNPFTGISGVAHRGYSRLARVVNNAWENLFNSYWSM